MHLCPNQPIEPVEAMSASFLYAIFKVIPTLKLRLVLSGFFKQSATVFLNLCYNLCNMFVVLFIFFLFIGGYLLYLQHFHPPPLRVDILVFLFFVSFISSPASHTIPFLPCDVLIVLIFLDCQSKPICIYPI